MKETELIAYQAYQAIGGIANQAGLLDNDDVIKALDYFNELTDSSVKPNINFMICWPPGERNE